MPERLRAFHQYVTVERMVSATMRDGVELTADIYRPKGVDALLPVLLMRLPYGRAIASTVVYAHPSWYAHQGFIVVIQDVRGCGSSGGKFYPFQAEYEDGYDTVEWAARLPGSNGKVGMYGFSYQGITQFQAAVMQPPSLVTICPAMASLDLYEGWLYWGGALCWEFALTWGLQLCQHQAQFKGQEPLATELFRAQQNLSTYLTTLPLGSLSLRLEGFFGDWLAHNQAEHSYWQSLQPRSLLCNYDLPALHIGGWADPFIAGTWQAYQLAVQQTPKPQRLHVGPWQHMPWRSRVGELDFGELAQSQVDALQIDWFNYWLKGIDNGIAKPVRQLFLTGKNYWLELDCRQTEADQQFCDFYLHPQAQLEPFAPAVASLPDIYVYDPRIPTPATAYGPYDQTGVNLGWDLLNYKSDPLNQEIMVVGVAQFKLFAASSAIATDWVVKLYDVYPDQREILITMAVQRCQGLLPDQVGCFQLDFRPICHCFEVGHQIGVAIASAAFPLIDRHGNSSNQPASQRVSEMVEATQRVYHSPGFCSMIRLPILSMQS